MQVSENCTVNKRRGISKVKEVRVVVDKETVKWAMTTWLWGWHRGMDTGQRLHRRESNQDHHIRYTRPRPPTNKIPDPRHQIFVLFIATADLSSIGPNSSPNTWSSSIRQTDPLFAFRHIRGVDTCNRSTSDHGLMKKSSLIK